jgi:hypothetical protein
METRTRSSLNALKFQLNASTQFLYISQFHLVVVSIVPLTKLNSNRFPAKSLAKNLVGNSAPWDPELNLAARLIALARRPLPAAQVVRPDALLYSPNQPISTNPSPTQEKGLSGKEKPTQRNQLLRPSHPAARMPPRLARFGRKVFRVLAERDVQLLARGGNVEPGEGGGHGGRAGGGGQAEGDGVKGFGKGEGLGGLAGRGYLPWGSC